MDLLNSYQSVNTSQPKVRSYHYITDIGKCSRQVIFNMSGEEREPYTVGEITKFKTGTLTQKDWEYAWFRKGILFTKELYIPACWGKPQFHGRADDLLYNLTFDDEFFLRCVVKGDSRFLKSIKPTDIILLEFKTARSTAFSYPDRIIKLPHKLQTWSYQIHLEEFSPSITIREHAFLFYVDRDGTQKPILHILERPDKELLKVEVKKLIQDYKNFKDHNILPPVISRELKKVKVGNLQKIKLVPFWGCSYCKYKKACQLPNYKLKENIIGTIKGSKFVPNKNYNEYKLKDFINDDEVKKLIEGKK